MNAYETALAAKQLDGGPMLKVDGQRHELYCAACPDYTDTVVAPNAAWLDTERFIASMLHGCPVRARPVDDPLRTGARPTRRNAAKPSGPEGVMLT